MSTFFSVHICLARVLAKRARAYLSDAVDIDREDWAASSTGILGSME